MASPSVVLQATVLISGGIDSLACIHLLRNQRFQIRGLFVDYGQAARAAERAAVRRLSRKLSFPVVFQNQRVGREFSPGEIAGRNAFLAFSALVSGVASKGVLAMGLHSGTPYYDCSPLFVARLSTLLAEYTDGRVQFVAPFIEWTKEDIVGYARAKRLPIGSTYSCEKGTKKPCGACRSCLDRKRCEC